MSKILMIGYDRYDWLWNLINDNNGLNDSKILEAYGIDSWTAIEKGVFNIVYFKQEETSEYINVGTMLKETITVPERKWGILIDCPMSCFIAALINTNNYIAKYYFKEIENTDNLKIMENIDYHERHSLVFPILEGSSIEIKGKKNIENKEFVNFINNILDEFCEKHEIPGREMKTFHWYTNRNWNAKHINNAKQKIHISSGDYFYYFYYDTTLVSDEELKNIILEKLADSKFADVPVVFTNNIDYWLPAVY